jgi:hypothetical protein
MLLLTMPPWSSAASPMDLPPANGQQVQQHPQQQKLLPFLPELLSCLQAHLLGLLLAHLHPVVLKQAGVALQQALQEALHQQLRQPLLHQPLLQHPYPQLPVLLLLLLLLVAPLPHHALQERQEQVSLLQTAPVPAASVQAAHLLPQAHHQG